MIAKNDEVKRSQIWRIVMTVSSVLIIVGAVLLLMKLFTTNPLEGEWTDEDGIFDMSISKDGTLVFTIPEAEEAASVDVDMRYTLNKEEKTITIMADESGFQKLADQPFGKVFYRLKDELSGEELSALLLAVERVGTSEGGRQ